MIKHIVISGGGPTGFVSYGVIKALHMAGAWNRETLQTVYGASIGGIVAVMAILGLEWKTLDDYIIKRPWEKAFQSVGSDILSLIANKGIDGRAVIGIIMEPLMQSAGLELHSTLEEMKQMTGVDVHFATVDVNGQKVVTAVDLCAATHPDMRICDAMAASLAVPLLFQPVIIDGSCYVDGGLLNNYPLSPCLEAHPDDTEAVFGIKNVWRTEDLAIRSETSFVEFVRTLVRKLHNTIDSTLRQPDLAQEVICDVSDLSNVERWVEAMESPELRASLVQKGENLANDYIKTVTTEPKET